MERVIQFLIYECVYIYIRQTNTLFSASHAVSEPQFGLVYCYQETKKKKNEATEQI
jgi:hypothetical protein